MKSLVDRLRDRCRIEPATGCWVWKQSTGGGKQPVVEIAELGNRTRNARRLMYLLAVGQLTEHRLVTTTCGDERCINPAHLKSISRSELNRKIARTRVRSGPARKKQAQTWHPVAIPPSRINGSEHGPTSWKPPRPVSPATSAYVAGLLTAAAIGMARKSPIGNDGSCGPLSEPGLGEWD